MKILYNTATQTLSPYPRADDEVVVGLSKEFDVFDVLQQKTPVDFDPETQALQKTETVDVVAKTVTRGWGITSISPPPVEVTMIALRGALIQLDLYMQVTAAINAIPDTKERLMTQQWWALSATVTRSSSLVAGIGAACGKADAEIDAVFALALEIQSQPAP